MTEPEWSGDVVEYNVVYRGMILSDCGIAVTRPNKINPFITSCVDVVRTWLIAREPSRVVAHHTGSAYLWFSLQKYYVSPTTY